MSMLWVFLVAFWFSGILWVFFVDFVFLWPVCFLVGWVVFGWCGVG